MKKIIVTFVCGFLVSGVQPTQAMEIKLSDNELYPVFQALRAAEMRMTYNTVYDQFALSILRCRAWALVCMQWRDVVKVIVQDIKRGWKHEGNYNRALALNRLIFYIPAENAMNADAQLAVQWGVDLHTIVYPMMGPRYAINFSDHQTPWLSAVQEGNKDLVEFFLKHGAYIDALEECATGNHPNRTMTALMVACKEDNSALVEFLLERNADCSIKNGERKMAYDFAKTPEIKQLLSDHMMENEIEFQEHSDED